jgi:hypothetical protein
MNESLMLLGYVNDKIWAELAVLREKFGAAAVHEANRNGWLATIEGDLVRISRRGREFMADHGLLNYFAQGLSGDILMPWTSRPA